MSWLKYRLVKEKPNNTSQREGRKYDKIWTNGKKNAINRVWKT